ncbi:MAG: DEAD/DEAH box helicase family protein [Candidatus Peribacter sp.]|nr:DEAD/DEAH box helicase family protein [Candidatus Peribacter sp.]
MLTQEHHILPLVQRETSRINARYPEHATTVEALSAEFTERFREGLNSFDDAFELCRRVEGMLNEHDIPEELLDAINSSRRRILFEIIQHGLEHKTLEGSVPVRFDLQFSPPKSKGKGTSKPPERSSQEYEEIVRRQNYDLIRLATWLGVDAAADVLCALGQVGEEERSRVISFISAYLGKCQSPEPMGHGGLLSYPKAVLEVPSVRSVVRRLLLQESYSTLLAQGVDDPDQHATVRRNIGKIALDRMTALAREANVSDPAIHAELFVETSNFLQRACTQPHPNTLVRTLSEKGKDCPFPSLRQLIAIQMLKEKRKLYVGFEPGTGKTPIPFHLLEQLRQGRKKLRMLYLGPLPVIQELPNRIRPGTAPQPTRDCYYVDPDSAPTVGIVSSELKNHELERTVRESDVTFCPYSMLHSRRDLSGTDDAGEQEPDQEERRLIDLLCEEKWDILVIDEAHFIDGNKEWTRLVDRLIHGEDGNGTHLSRKGYTVALSGSPIMNTVADPVVIHDLLTPPREREHRYGSDLRETTGRNPTVERGLDPIRVRNALDTLLILDKPEPWLQHVETLDYEISDREMVFIRGICTTPGLHAKHKADACHQFLLCPKLVSGDETMPESLLEWVTMQLDHDLQEKHSVLITENMRAQGVLRDATGKHAPGPDEMEQHFFRKIEQYCRDWEQRHGIPAHFHTVHGETPQDDRQTAYADAADAQVNGTHKSVNFAMAQCLNVGIRLNYNRIITLEWPYNSPELQQLLKRALREGNLDVFLTACYAKGTVQQGIYDQAMDKYRDALQCMYGIGVTDDILRSHLREREQADSSAESESELFRLLLRTSPSQRRYEVERWLHGRGMNGVTQFWDRHRDLFEVLHQEADEMGTGDQQRFLAGLVAGLMDRESGRDLTVLDVNSGGLTLERELRRMGRNTQGQVMSIDPFVWMLERGRADVHHDDPTRHQIPSCLNASPVDIHRSFQNGRLGTQPYDIGILRNLEQCNHIQSDGVVHERARALLNLVNTTRIGGRVVIPLPRTACTNEEFEFFVGETLPLFGCLVVDGWQGAVRSQDNEDDEPFRGFCVVAEKYEDVNEQTLRSQLRSRHLHFSHHAQWAQTAEGARVANAIRRPRLPYPIRHQEFRLGNRIFAAADAKFEIRNAQVEHLHALENAVRTITTLASTKREWNALTASGRQSLKRQGILYSSDISRTVNRPTFSLQAYPGHLFFAYDPQWTGL